MNTTYFSDQSHVHANRPTTNEPHLVVQILSIIAFGVFSIVGIALAFAAFWVAGLLLAAVIASVWARSRVFGGTRSNSKNCAKSSMADLAPNTGTERASSNASFEAYRSEMLQRLEQENRDFEGFLARLRDANDAQEFDDFMDHRAKRAVETHPVSEPEPIPA